jgi:hypothetical protein
MLFAKKQSRFNLNTVVCQRPPNCQIDINNRVLKEEKYRHYKIMVDQAKELELKSELQKTVMGRYQKIFAWFEMKG